MRLFFVILLLILCSGCLHNFVQQNQMSDLFDGKEPQVRVRILYTLEKVDVLFLGEWQAKQTGLDDVIEFDSFQAIQINQDQMKLHLISGPDSQSIQFDSLEFISNIPEKELKIFNVPYGIGWWWAGVEDRRYEGKINVYPGKNGKPQVVVTLLLEDYLYGVIPYEMGGDSPLEALKAQAVAARSEAVKALTSNLYSGAHFDLTSDVECQVFSGNHKRTPVSDWAVAETRGIILTEQGRPINAYYASNCGGHSELIQNVWPKREAFKTYKMALQDNEKHTEIDLCQEEVVRAWINSDPKVYCNPNLDVELPSWSQKNFRWQRTYAVDSLTKMLSAGKNVGQLKNIEVLKRGRSGRAYQARFDFEKESIEVQGELSIRQMWQPPLRSSCFIVDQKEDQFIVSGAGWGHGVGMCQSGAVSQAMQGRNFSKILKHYYGKAQLSPIY